MSGELDPENALQVNDRLVYPNLGEPLQRRRTAQWPSTCRLSRRAPRRLTHGCRCCAPDTIVAELPVPLQAADATGRIRQVSQVPAGGLGTGDFQFRLVVDARPDGGSARGPLSPRHRLLRPEAIFPASTA